MKNVLLVLVCLCLNMRAVSGSREVSFAPILDTQNLGRLVGVQEFSEDRVPVPYYSFRGIRYAEPPVGQLRFKVCIRVYRKFQVT